jgi:trehalose 6-phosphate phosphatase
VEREIRRLAAPLSPHFTVQGGKMLWEIKPGSRDKGTAMRDFMAEPPFAGRTPVAIGDDVTDEALLEAANRLNGASIKVGPGDSNALYRLPDPPGVRRWLQSWLDWMSAR